MDGREALSSNNDGDGYAGADEQPDMTKGVSANLHNNLWGTAFPQYYGDDGQARFQIVI